MPKVIVYVPVAAWRKLEARGLDPAQAVREFARQGYELTEPGLTERDQGAETYPAATASQEGMETGRTRTGSSPAGAVSRSASPVKRSRAHPCKHHFPPSKHCTFGCDD